MTREEARDAAIELLALLLEKGSWYSSAIELDNYGVNAVYGDRLEERAKEIVAATKAGESKEPPDAEAAIERAFKEGMEARHGMERGLRPLGEDTKEEAWQAFKAEQ